MRFCSKCGTRVEDGVKFCTNCGNPMPAEQQGYQTNPQMGQQAYQTNQQTNQQTGQPNTGYVPTGYAPDGTKQAGGGIAGNKNRLIGMIVTAALAIVAIVLVINLFSCVFGSGYEAPIKKLCNAMEDGDVDDLLDAFAFDGIDDVLSVAGMSLSSITEEMEDEIDEIKCDSVKYKIKDKEKIDKDDYSSNITYPFTLWIDTDDIGGMYELEVEFTAKQDDEEETNTMTLVVAKVDGEWKIVGGDISSLF